MATQTVWLASATGKEGKVCVQDLEIQRGHGGMRSKRSERPLTTWAPLHKNILKNRCQLNGSCQQFLLRLQPNLSLRWQLSLSLRWQLSFNKFSCYWPLGTRRTLRHKASQHVSPSSELNLQAPKSYHLTLTCQTAFKDSACQIT